jgi:hypothetical protein
MNIPVEQWSFSTNNQVSNDDVVFDFVNAGSLPQLVVKYDKGAGCQSSYKKMTEELNLGVIEPVHGVSALLNDVNKHFHQSRSCSKPDFRIELKNNIDVSNLNTNSIGHFSDTATNSFAANALFSQMPEAVSETLSNKIKFKSIARVQGDTNLIDPFSTLELRDDAQIFLAPNMNKKTKNTIEKGSRSLQDEEDDFTSNRFQNPDDVPIQRKEFKSDFRVPYAPYVPPEEPRRTAPGIRMTGERERVRARGRRQLIAIARRHRQELARRQAQQQAQQAQQAQQQAQPGI